MNGANYPRGCAGAVWADGSHSEDYCENKGYADGKYPWWGNCCQSVLVVTTKGSHRECVTKQSSGGFA